MRQSALFLILVCLSFSAQAGQFLSSTYVTLEVEAAGDCKGEKVLPITGLDNQVIAHLCAKPHSSCSIEGSCLIKNGSETKIVAFARMDKLTHTSRWTELNPARCKYGLGVKNICLDPYYTASADPEVYKLGDVLFVKSLKGLQLPSGEIHTGHLIIRDFTPLLVGTGPDRLHVYTGLKSEGFNNDLLESFDLTGNTKSFEFEKLDEKSAEKVRAARNYPAIPGASLSERVEK